MGLYFNEDDLLALDVILNDVERQATGNDDLIRKLDQYHLAVVGDLSGFLSVDPLSEDYKHEVGTIHEEIIGKCYSEIDEGLPILDPDYEKDWPYPWGTKSPETVARFLISYGFLIKVAALPPNARVLEVGCGLGSLTWSLSRMGYRVDALDPNEVQCGIVRAATRDFPVPPNVISMTLDQWLSAKADHYRYKYDAVIFFESFHHIANHQECLRRILESHLEADGEILLAAEPILDGLCDRLPYPWGPRLDGESLRAMRRWGWLELGFTEDYLRRLFAELRLTFERTSCAEAFPHSQIVVGRRRDNGDDIGADEGGRRYPGNFGDRIDMAVAGLPDFVTNVVGLGICESWGRWTIGDKLLIRFRNKLPSHFSVLLELADVFGPNVHKRLVLRAGNIERAERLTEIGARRHYRFEFDMVDSSELEILVPHPCRPKDIVELENEDTRKIGLAIVGLTIRET